MTSAAEADLLDAIAAEVARQGDAPSGTTILSAGASGAAGPALPLRHTLPRGTSRLEELKREQVCAWMDVWVWGVRMGLCGRVGGFEWMQGGW